MEELISAEEEILKAFKNIFDKELPAVIEEVNSQKKENWITGPETVKTDESFNERDRMPSLYISVSKTRKKLEDTFIEKGVYKVEISLYLGRSTENGMEFRYGAVISKLLKESELLREVSDRAVLEEIDFIKKGNITNSGYRETLYRIAVMREGF